MAIAISDHDRQEIINEVLDRISCGEPLRKILREEGKPHWTTFYDWLDKDESMRVRFARAREIGADAIAMEALEIADTPVMGRRREWGPEGTKEIEDEMLGHRKLQIDTRLKLLAKWFPQKYGDKQQIEHSGGIESNTPQINLTLSGVTAADLKRKLTDEDKTA